MTINANYISLLKEVELLGDEKAERVAESARKIIEEIRGRDDIPYLWHDSLTQAEFVTRYVEQMFGEGTRVRVVDEQTIEVEIPHQLETEEINTTFNV